VFNDEPEYSLCYSLPIRASVCESLIKLRVSPAGDELFYVSGFWFDSSQ